MPEVAAPEIPEILKEAQWIWPDNHHWDLYNCYALFRLAFTLKDLPDVAPLFITADQSYQLSINGRYVCRGPARGFQKSWPFDEVDARPWLKKGKNVIAVRAHNPGRSNFQYLHQGYAGLLLAADWNGTKILTSRDWKCRRQRGVNRNIVPTSIQLFPQEDIDLRVEDPAWMQPGFQEDESWSPVEVGVSPWNAMPWYGLESRGIPMLDEEVIPSGRVIGAAEGKNAPDWRAERNLAINRFREGLGHHPASAKALIFEPSRRGRWRSVLIDFGRMVVGSVILEISGAQGGEAVETFHTEKIAAEKLEPHFVVEPHSRMAFAHRLTCREGKQGHQFYHPFGFRYMVLTVRDNAAPLRIKASLRKALYPHETVGSFRSSDAELQKIWQVCEWTERICSMDAYVDTPWREQAQWWGDARVQAWNTFHMSGDNRLFRRGIRQIAAQTTPSGITYGHAPTMAHNCILPDFTIIWMATLWDDYWQTGSPEAFLAHQETIDRALAYFQEWTDPASGLLDFDNRYWLFLDWTDLQKDGQPSVYSLWLLYALDRLAILAGLTGQSRKAGEYRRRAAGLRVALRRMLQPSGLLGDGILPSGEVNPETSIHAQTLALINQLAPKSEKVMLEKVLLPFLRGSLEAKAMPSAYWITYVYTELATRGFGAEVVAHIRRHWAPMAEYGSTFETFDDKLASTTCSHAWSAHPLFHFMQILGGIRQTAAGWRKILLAPSFVGDRADVTVPTPLGLVQSSWQRRGTQRVIGEFVLPEGIEAEVRLPGEDAFTVAEAGTVRFDVGG